LTIVELIIFIVVVSVALVGVLVAMNVTSQHSGDAQLRKQALSIAEALLEEVESARFTYCDYQDTNASLPNLTGITPGVGSAGNPGCASIIEGVGPEGGNTRPYDNVNDYVTKLGTQQAISLNNANGVTITGLTGNYVPCITITSTTLDQMEPDSGANPAIGSALLIKIDVYNGTGIACGSTSSLTPVVTLEGLRTQYAPNVPP
jgi:MSHA pilin protein MshD